MPTYAAKTTVSVAASKAEIEATLQRYGANQFIQGWDAASAVIGFRVEGRQIKITLPLPSRAGRDITHSSTGRQRTETQALNAYEQACRQAWRGLLLVIKAKLEAIECGISTIEREFLADTVMSNGMTVYEWTQPQIQEMYESGKMPPLLPGVEQRRIEG